MRSSCAKAGAAVNVSVPARWAAPLDVAIMPNHRRAYGRFLRAGARSPIHTGEFFLACSPGYIRTSPTRRRLAQVRRITSRGSRRS